MDIRSPSLPLSSECSAALYCSDRSRNRSEQSYHNADRKEGMNPIQRKKRTKRTGAKGVQTSEKQKIAE